MTETQGNTGSAIGVLLGIVGLVALASYLSKKRCSHCGTDNPSDARNCLSCGRFI